MVDDHFDDVALQNLSKQHTATSNFSDHASFTPPEGHQARMNEFLNRPATPPPFPEDLPARPGKKPLNIWMLTTFALLVAFLATVIPLAVLLGMARSKSTSTALPSPALEALPSTTTALSTMTLLNTTILTSTTVSPTTITSIETLSFPELSYVTTTITAAPASSGIASDPAADRAACDKRPPILGRNFCVMFKPCDEAKMDVKQNDCKNFCEDAGLICKTKSSKGDRVDITPQMEGCCGHCGCF